MKFSIKDPNDHTPIVLTMVPEEFEGEQVLKVIFPEKDSIMMVRKNGIWSTATETDLSDQLVKAISRGIHAHIKQTKIYLNPIGFKMKGLKSTVFLLLVTGSVTLAACMANNTKKPTDAVMTDATHIDTQVIQLAEEWIPFLQTL